MGERKGTNKYYPPDYDPKMGGLNKFMGTHALRERARKLHLGIMIIRFEMPYNIWCEGCNNHIGMGVRYNAEKKKTGMYYSTPVYEFRMKCHLCDNHFEIKTDPANLDYVIISGARRQERRWDPTENGQVVPDDKQVIHKLADDAMFKLQHGVEDQNKMRDVTPTISKLEDLQERWKDDYTANRALRDIFRAKKREINEQQTKDNEFLKKRSLDIPLLEESEDDAKVASLIRLIPTKSIEERQAEKRLEIDKKSIFPFPLVQPTMTTNDSDCVVHTSTNGFPKVVSAPSDLEKRRLSFGIKLKKSGSSAKDDAPELYKEGTSAPSGSTEKESACSHDQNILMQDVKEDEFETNLTRETCEATVSTPDFSVTVNPKCFNGDDSYSLTNPHHTSSHSTHEKLEVKPNASRNTEKPISKLVGGFSSLVSYSDDSDENSASPSPQVTTS